MEQKCEQTRNGSTMTGCIDTKAITRVVEKKHRISWTIENISKVELYTRLYGPDFHLNPSCMVNISFERSSDMFWVFLCNKSDSEIRIGRKIYLFDCNSRNLHKEENDEIFTLEKDEEVDTLGDINYESIYDAMPNNTLIIDLSISMVNAVMTDVFRYQHRCMSSRFIDHQRKLIDDFKTMQENRATSDISLQIGEDRISAHWSVLCSRSPYFKRMFESEKLERNLNSITITDLSLCALKKLVRYLYTADFDENDEEDIEELFHLYCAADKYEMSDMRALCGSKIMSKATADNVCQILQFALRHSDEDLKSQATAFIKLNCEAFFQTDGWKKFLNQVSH